MKRKPIALHYCNHCKSTTRHSETETTSTCLRCGAEKYITRLVRSRQARQQEDSQYN